MTFFKALELRILVHAVHRWKKRFFCIRYLCDL